MEPSLISSKHVDQQLFGRDRVLLNASAGIPNWEAQSDVTEMLNQAGPTVNSNGGTQA